MATKRDYYEILEIPKNASEAQIKQSYRKLAVKYHPDHNPGNKLAEEKFKEIKEAYEVLYNSNKRAQYDRYGHEAFSETMSNNGSQKGFSNFSDVFEGFEDLFEGFFGKSTKRSKNNKRRGEDLLFDFEIDLEDVINGKTTTIKIPKNHSCSYCKGSGAKSGTSPQSCSTCEGSGQISRAQGFFSFTSTCHTCKGSGVIIKTPCSQCYGKGVIQKNQTISIKIPPGVETGTRIKIAGEGNSKGYGSITGDLYIIIHIRPHEFFERKGYNLYCEIPVSFSQLTLGNNISVPLPKGKKIKLKIPPGTQTNQIFCIRGGGITSLQNYGVGDMHVKVIAETPKDLTNEQKKLLEKFANLRNENFNPQPKSLYEKIKNTFK